MKALWKQEAALDPSFLRIHRCLTDDWFLLPFELRLQLAHATTLEAAGLLSADEVSGVREACEAIAERYVGAPPPDSDAEDLHTWFEGTLTERAGEVGRKIHAGRSRNDQIATLLKLYVIDRGEALARALGTFERTLAKRAVEWADLEMPFQTHTQFAAPGSAGAWALRYAIAVDRLRDELAWLSSSWHRHCPLGAGAVAGSSLPIDRALQARALGFDGPSPSALDSTTTRDECLQLLAALARLGLHLGSLAADGIAFAQTPFGWLRVPAGFATGSSMMPNKSNPDALELLRGEACALPAAHAHALILLKGLPSGYNRDLQCLKPVLRDAAERGLALLELATAFVLQMAFDEDRLRAAMALGDLGATLRMEARVRAGATLRDAHHAEAGSADRTPGVAASATAYRTAGSASPSEVRREASRLLEGA